jgi:transaldolase
MNPIQQLHALGQSIWYDNIQRKLLENGELAGMAARGEIRGVTSNPSIFHNAIAKSHDYDAALLPLAASGASKEAIYELLAIADIQAACDLFLPLYAETSGGDGYVSLEVSPYLAHDTEGTAADASRLWEQVNRPNLMIKIPATLEGLPAITRTIAAGINVNVTLIFSIGRYEAVMEAYMAGLEARLAAGGEINRIASVASFFVSRIDTAVDRRLEELGGERALALRGKIAVASAKAAYVRHKAVFSGERWAKLAGEGARIQRALWASTSTKNPAYPDTKYVDELIGPDTVNTVPPKTLAAFRDHGTAAPTLESNLESAHAALDELAALGISLDAVTQELETQGVEAFANAFTALLTSIEEKRQGNR